MKKEITIIDSLGEVIEVSTEQIQSLSTIFDNPYLLKKLRDRDISIQAFERVRDLIQRKRWKQFTSNDLAFELNMSNRNAQRLLHSFNDAKIVEQIGEEKVTTKGRPRKLYRMNKTFLDD